MDLFPPSSTENAPSKGLSDYSRSGSESEQPDDLAESLDALTEDPVQEEQQEEPEAEASEGEVSANEDDQEQTEEAPEYVSSRTKNRIQKLANEKRELRQENEELKALVSEIREANRLGRESLEANKVFVDKQREKLTVNDKLDEMRRLGFNPEDKFHHFVHDIGKDFVGLQSRLESLNQELVTLRQEKAAREYEDSLRQGLKTRLKGYEVSDGDFADLYEAAIEAATARGLQADEAAATVAKRVARFMKPKQKREAVKSSESAHRAIATSGRSGAANPGPKREPRSFEEALSSLYKD